MAKRYTDTDKWKKPFIRNMKAPYKLLWLYLLDECDHAGIWQVDLEVAQIKIGERLKLETATEQLAGKIHVFAGGEKWFIPDFIEFQYGTLNEENRVHKSVIDLLTKYDLLDIKSDLNKTHTSPLQGAMDKDKDKDKELDKDKNKEPAEKFEIEFPFNSDQFRAAWQFWKDYKKSQYGFYYKSPVTEQVALNALAEKAGNIEQEAISIIKNSAANGWQGLFKSNEKNYSNGNTHKRDGRREPATHGTEFGKL